MEAVLGYKLNKNNCPISCRQYLFKSDTRKRCYFCCTDLAAPQQKKKKAGMSSSKAQSQVCDKLICSIHAIYMSLSTMSA